MRSIFDDHKRRDRFENLDVETLSGELLEFFTWDQRLRQFLFHGEEELSHEVRKKYRYHITKNARYFIDITDELIKRGDLGVKELEKLFAHENPELKYILGSVAQDYFPLSAEKELLRTLSNSTLHRKHIEPLEGMLAGIKRR